GFPCRGPNDGDWVAAIAARADFQFKIQEIFLGLWVLLLSHGSPQARRALMRHCRRHTTSSLYHSLNATSELANLCKPCAARASLADYGRGGKMAVGSPNITILCRSRAASWQASITSCVS